MDKLYKPLLLQILKQRMADEFPHFGPVKISRDAPMHEIFSGTLLFCSDERRGSVIWLCWEPGPGVERSFDVRLGWSPSRHVLPVHHDHDRRIFALRAPNSDFTACSLPLQQVLGYGAIGPYVIPSPWDQVNTLKPSTPAHEQKRVMQKAIAEAQALSPQQRLASVSGVLDQVFTALHAVLPSFMLRTNQR